MRILRRSSWKFPGRVVEGFIAARPLIVLPAEVVTVCSVLLELLGTIGDRQSGEDSCACDSARAIKRLFIFA